MKFTTSWGRYASKNLKKGNIGKSAVKGALGTGLMLGAMLAYDEIRDLKENNGDDILWLNAIMKLGSEPLGQSEIGLITICSVIFIMTVLGCCWSITKQSKTVENGEGSWTWSKAEKPGEDGLGGVAEKQANTEKEGYEESSEV